MPIEVACGSCHGRMLVEAAGTFACPHCGVHVSVSSEAFPELAAPESSAGTAENSLPEVDEATAVWTPSGEMDEFPDFSTLGTADAQVPTPGDTAFLSTPEPQVENVDMPDFSVSSGTALDDDDEAEDLIQGGLGSMFGSGPQITKSSSNVFSGSGPIKTSSNGSAVLESSPRIAHAADGSATPVVAAEPVATPSTVQPASAIPIFAPHDSPTTVPQSQPAAESSSSSAPPETPAETTAPSSPSPQKPEAAAPPAMVPLQWLILVGSYASAITLLCIWMFLRMNAPAHRLESLPDVKPKINKKNQIARYVIPPEVAMPPGHTLSVGESQRYGNILVEVLRIEKSPVEFEHYDADPTKTRDPGGDVLKLWLKFTNVSSDQTIIPLGEELTYENRAVDPNDFERYRANNFVCRSSEKKAGGRQIDLYHLNLNDNWNLRGQDINRELQPGESYVTYLATTEAGVDDLSGECIWRVQLRKGYSPNGYGVTTIIEVAFRSDQIHSGGPAESEQAAKPSKA